MGIHVLFIILMMCVIGAEGSSLARSLGENRATWRLSCKNAVPDRTYTVHICVITVLYNVIYLYISHIYEYIEIYLQKIS